MSDQGRGYRPIKDYAPVGDCHGGALVANDGSVDWCCLGRFDADPLFCRLLDAERGGYLSTTPGAATRVSRGYLDDTNILRTRFDTAAGSVSITDFMPVGRKPGAGPYDYSKLNAPSYLIRLIEGLAGSVELNVSYRPSVAFARRPAQVRKTAQGIVLEHGIAVLSSDLPFTTTAEGADAAITIAQGERYFIAIGKTAYGLTLERVHALFRITRAFWQEWIGYCRYAGPYAEHVRRSALALKLMTYAPTGTCVAALTTSLPERPGGTENWDYRYCWIRDASLMLQALASLGYSGEARQFFAFTRTVLNEPIERLQIMYGVGMERALAERHLEHLDGYRGSRPVRTGNAAYEQRQTDLHGYVLDGALTYRMLGGKLSRQDREAFARVADFVAECWFEPDMGLWELRRDPQHYVHSKAMCWVVMDRAIRLVGARRRWLDVRERIWRDIHDHGLAPEGHLLQAYAPPAEARSDAALLQLCMLGLPDDPELFQRTRGAVERSLRRGDLMARFASDDQENGFLICSFWHVDALLREDRPAEARALFERLLEFANDVGLFAEQAEPFSAEARGNFPQAFTHLGLVGSAVNLELFERHGLAGLRGTYADRAKRKVWATFGWRGVLSGLAQSRRIHFFSSRKSVLEDRDAGAA